jgi:hypothetical protein
MTAMRSEMVISRLAIRPAPKMTNPKEAVAMAAN